MIILMFESCLFQKVTKLVGVEGIASVFISSVFFLCFAGINHASQNV